MEKIIGITETRSRIKELIDHVSEKKDIFVITRDSKPEAVVMAYEEYIRTKQEIEEAKIIKFEKTLTDLRIQFGKWMEKKGLDINNLTEDEIYEIIKND
jgi:prevent-host-death family protein